MSVFAKVSQGNPAGSHSATSCTPLGVDPLLNTTSVPLSIVVSCHSTHLISTHPTEV